MYKFVDETAVRIKAGNGGAGSVSFRTEKYIEMGGPDGGDGGRGGDVFIQADHRIINLSHIRRDKLYNADNGQDGSGRNWSGRKGEDLIVKVPYGTQIHNHNKTILLHDCVDEEKYCIAHGARGGKGNAFFKSATRQSPRFAQPGEKTEEKELTFSLKLIADIGLVGFPNAGKSTLLRKLTSAKPKIGNYPFTTLSPNLGVLELNPMRSVIIADIPGIIEGASEGSGLGLSFLKHIERVKFIVFVLDLSLADVEAELKVLRLELEQYNEKLLDRPFIIVLNKTDLIEDNEFVQEYIKSFSEEKGEIIAVSAVSGDSINELLKLLEKKIVTLDD